MPNVDGDDAIDAVFVVFPPYSLNFHGISKGFYHGMGMSRMPSKA